MINYIKNNKLKATAVIGAFLVFVVGIVVTIINSGSTYALSIDDYECSSSGYDVITNSGNYYCCPSGWTYFAGIKKCANKSSKFTGIEAQSECESKNYGYFFDSSAGGGYYCTTDVQTAVRKSYTVSFNANGGSGAPGSHTTYVNTAITIPSVEPTREGYTFLGWSKYGADSVQYVAGDKYTGTVDITLYAVWEKDNSSDDTVSYYTVSFNANGGSGAPVSHKARINVAITIPSVEPTREGYTFLGWSKYGADSVQYVAGDKYTGTVDITLYAVWEKDSGGGSTSSGNTGTDSETGSGSTDTGSGSGTGTGGESGTGSGGNNETITYNISYTLNGGTVSGNPTSATYDEVVTIKAPTKTVTVVGNVNDTGATVGKVSAVEQKFAGWTSSTINTSTAYYGSTAWKNGSTKVTDTKFKNLTDVNGGTVTMVANWTPVDITLPTVTKDGYTCSWNTKSDGKGDSYKSGSKYTPGANSISSVNMYAICEVNSKADEEITENKKTGDVLIVIAWLIGIGTLGYSVYYFRSRKIDI